MKKLFWGIIGLGLVLFFSCNKNSSDKAPVSIGFYVTDAPAVAAYQSVKVDVQSVQYSLDGEKWIDLAVTPAVIDLLTLTNGKQILLSNITLDAGVRIQQIRLVLGAANTLTLADGTVVDLKTPSGQTSGLKVNVQSMVTLTSGYKVIIDFDAARSIVAQGNGGYSLKPVIRAYIDANSSAVSGNLIPANIETRVFTVTGTGDTISTLSDTTKNNFFLLHGLFSGTYDVKVQDLTSLEVGTIKERLVVVGGTDIDLGVIAMPFAQ